MTSSPVLTVLWLCSMLVAAVASAIRGWWLLVVGWAALGVFTVVQARRRSPWSK